MSLELRLNAHSGELEVPELKTTSDHCPTSLEYPGQTNSLKPTLNPSISSPGSLPLILANAFPAMKLSVTLGCAFGMTLPMNQSALRNVRTRGFHTSCRRC